MIAVQVPLLTRQQVAELLSVQTQTLAKWAMTGAGPRFVRCGRAVRYRPADVETYLESQTVGGVTI